MKNETDGTGFDGIVSRRGNLNCEMRSESLVGNASGVDGSPQMTQAVRLADHSEAIEL